MAQGAASGAADAAPPAPSCQLITQCSLGREDSSASLSRMEQENLWFGIEGWQMLDKVCSSRADAGGRGDADSPGSSRQVLEFANTLQTVTSAMNRVAERNVQLQLEAAEWRKKYESLLQEKNRGTGSTAKIVDDEQDHIVAEENGSYKFLIDAKEQSSHKASFKLLWSYNGDKHRRHKHDIVSYDCGNISAVTSSNKQIILVWESTPRAVCIFTRPNSSAVQELCKKLIRWLKDEKNITVYVEQRVKDELDERSDLQTWNSGEELLFLHTKVDLVITLGGDGTVLWAASLFKGPVPPMVSFSMGSLGFMTAFQSDRYKECLEYVMKGPVCITLRHRMQCQIVKSGESSASEVHLVLNEVSIDRGMSSCLTNLECYCDNLRPGRRAHPLHHLREHGLLSRRRRLHGSSSRSSDSVHADMPAFPVVPASDPTRVRDAEGPSPAPKRLGILRRERPGGAPPRRSAPVPNGSVASSNSVSGGGHASLLV